MKLGKMKLSQLLAIPVVGDGGSGGRGKRKFYSFSYLLLLS